MAVIYIVLQSLAVLLAAVDCWFPAVILAGAALLLGFLPRLWGAITPFRAPRPYEA